MTSELIVVIGLLLYLVGVVLTYRWAFTRAVLEKTRKYVAYCLNAGMLPSRPQSKISIPEIRLYAFSFAACWPIMWPAYGIHRLITSRDEKQIEAIKHISQLYYEEKRNAKR